MPLRLKLLFFVALLFVCRTGVSAQDVDYLKHGKIFNYCSFKLNCDACYTCENNRYEIKIRNNENRKIKTVRYKYYSSVYNRIETKTAKIEGDVISEKQNVIVYICIPNINHWAISEIVYDDNSSVTFTVHGHLQDFMQEPDECDCDE